MVQFRWHLLPLVSVRSDGGPPKPYGHIHPRDAPGEVLQLQASVKRGIQRRSVRATLGREDPFCRVHASPLLVHLGFVLHLIRLLHIQLLVVNRGVNASLWVVIENLIVADRNPAAPELQQFTIDDSEGWIDDTGLLTDAAVQQTQNRSVSAV